MQVNGGFHLPQLNWTNLISRLAREWKNKNLAKLSWKLYLAVTVYNIWVERNSRLHNLSTNGVIQITEKIIDMVKLKLSSLRAVHDSLENRATAMRWNLPTSIFAS